MENHKIDFLKEKYALSKPNEKPFIFFGRTVAVVILVLATFGVIFSYRVVTTTEGKAGATSFSLFSAIRSFMTPNDSILNGEKEDRVNILLTGIGGEGHDGPQLTDTILFASYRPSTKKLGLMSFPRDMTVEIPGHGYQKVNHANAYAEIDKKGSGASVAADLLGGVIEQPVQYYMRVDFNGFLELVDSVGGVDIYIDHPFTDSNYPILGKEYDTCGNSKAVMNSTLAELSETEMAGPDYRCRFEVLTFKEGWMHMNGSTALAFVRSRHGNNGEGSDFARSRRQQKILLGVKDKVFSVSTFFNPLRISSILDTLQKNINTNLSVSELVRLGKEFKDLKSEDIVNHVIDASPNSPLYETTVNGAYVLLPKNDDWTQLQQMARYIFTAEKDDERSVQIAKKVEQTPAPVVKKQTPSRVDIENGTNIAGLAFRASQILNAQNEGFDVIKVGNAPTRGFTHTIIYDLTNGQKSSELKALQTFFQSDVTLSSSGWMTNSDVVKKELSVSSEDVKQMVTGSDIDFLVILGENSQNFVLR